MISKIYYQVSLAPKKHIVVESIEEAISLISHEIEKNSNFPLSWKTVSTPPDKPNQRLCKTTTII